MERKRTEQEKQNFRQNYLKLPQISETESSENSEIRAVCRNLNHIVSPWSDETVITSKVEFWKENHELEYMVFANAKLYEKDSQLNFTDANVKIVPYEDLNSIKINYRFHYFEDKLSITMPIGTLQDVHDWYDQDGLAQNWRGRLNFSIRTSKSPYLNFLITQNDNKINCLDRRDNRSSIFEIGDNYSPDRDKYDYKIHLEGSDVFVTRINKDDGEGLYISVPRIMNPAELNLEMNHNQRWKDMYKKYPVNFLNI